MLEAPEPGSLGISLAGVLGRIDDLFEYIDTPPTIDAIDVMDGFRLKAGIFSIPGAVVDDIIRRFLGALFDVF